MIFWDILFKNMSICELLTSPPPSPPLCNRGGCRMIDTREQTLFLGQRGKLHFTGLSKLSNDTETQKLLFESIPFDKLVDMAYVFNYDDENLGSILGSQNFLGKRVNVQLDESEWSKPFSLELVGVGQTISIYHNSTYDKRLPEGGKNRTQHWGLLSPLAGSFEPRLRVF